MEPAGRARVTVYRQLQGDGQRWEGCAGKVSGSRDGEITETEQDTGVRLWADETGSRSR